MFIIYLLGCLFITFLACSCYLARKCDELQEELQKTKESNK